MTREDAVAEITRRLVEFCEPVRIYLFGSVARGDDGPDSDLDFLVVAPDDIAPEKLRGGVLARIGNRPRQGHRAVAAYGFRATGGLGDGVAAGDRHPKRLLYDAG